MTQESIMKMFVEANKKREHLVNITGIGNWVCPFYFLENSKNCLTIENPKDILKMNFCPFCGERLDENKFQKKEPIGRYVVYHYQPYYFGEYLPDEWYWKDTDYQAEAFEEYNGLLAAGFNEGDIYIEDRLYGLTFNSGEWNY